MQRALDCIKVTKKNVSFDAKRHDSLHCDALRFFGRWQKKLQPLGRFKKTCNVSQIKGKTKGKVVLWNCSGKMQLDVQLP